MQSAKARDPVDMEALARLWWPAIRRWCLLHLGDEALAEDASQEVLTQLATGAQSYDPARPFGPWLRVVVRNTCHKLARQQRRHGHELLEERPDPAPGPLALVGQRRRADRVFAAFEALTERQREVLTGCTLEGRPGAEVAAELGISPATVRATLHQARRALRKALGEDQ